MTLDVARGADEDVSNLGGFHHGHDAETVHHGFQCFEMIDFCDDDVAAQAASAHGDTATAPTVADDNNIATLQSDSWLLG